MIDATVSSLCQVILHERGLAGAHLPPVVGFVTRQLGRMPDFTRLPFRMLIVLFGLQTLLLYGTPFAGASGGLRAQQVSHWRASRLGFRRDFIRFFDSLVVFSAASEVAS